jgi:serine/threonine-protein kinase
MSIETAPTDPAPRPCPHGVFRPGSPAGLCPRCLYESVLAEEPDPEEQGSDRRSLFGGYELIKKLGEGGMGVVYMARQIGGIRRVVALKRIREGELAGDAERRRFLDEAEGAAKLHHPHIVPIYDVGEDNGQPYFTMKLMSGGTLAEARARFAEPRRAAALVRAIARAVHAGHKRRILHRDLKPENILFDERGRPYVADFGVAKHLEREGNTATDVMAPGTIPYMAPEQTAPHAHRNTVAVDVWSLGVILYELLAGRRPFDGPTVLEVVRSAAEEQPEPLERLRPDVDRDLATICLTCLHKEPGRRYISAKALADDLDRYLRGMPPVARRPTRFERAQRWCRRYPVVAATFGSAAIVLVTLTLWALAGVRAQERARRDEVLDTNVYAARAVAGTVLAQLNAYADQVAKEARDPRLVEAVERGDEQAVQALCKDIHARHSGNAAPNAWFIFDAGGMQLGRVPAPKYGGSFFMNFAFRDYFQGAMALAARSDRPAYVGRAIRATSDNEHKLTIASPIVREDGSVVGVLAAALVTGRQLGALKLSDDRRIAVLAVRRDRYAPGEPLPDEHILLVHDGVEHGEGVVIESGALRRLTARREADGGAGKNQIYLPPPDWVEAEDDYRDPLAGRDRGGAAGGPWLAGMAAVGHTELTVIVQTRLEDATALDRAPLRVLAAWSVGGAALLCAALFAALRNSRRPRPRVQAEPIERSGSAG